MTIHRASNRPSAAQAYQCKITQLPGMATQMQLKGLQGSQIRNRKRVNYNQRPSWIWAFQVSGLPQLLGVSLMIVFTCQDHMLESLKIAFFVVILDSKYSKMTPKFVKQKSHWLHSSIKFANPVFVWKEITCPPRLLERKRNNKVVSFSALFYKFTLTWITKKELEWVIENKGDEFRREKNTEIQSGGEKMRNEASKVKMSGGEK